jgi:NAD(P)-dependent dehydrogenase (short-subunit alcohol dehydrogenase family)
MLPAGRDVISNIGSVFATIGMPIRAVCAASKHGVVDVTKVLATEFRQRRRGRRRRAGLRRLVAEPYEHMFACAPDAYTDWGARI